MENNLSHKLLNSGAFLQSSHKQIEERPLPLYDKKHKHGTMEQTKTDKILKDQYL